MDAGLAASRRAPEQRQRRRSDPLWHEESGEWVQCFRDATQIFMYRTGTWAPGGRVHALDLNGDGREELLRYDWRTGEWTLGALDGAGSHAAVGRALGERLGDDSWRPQRRRPRSICCSTTPTPASGSAA